MTTEDNLDYIKAWYNANINNRYQEIPGVRKLCDVVLDWIVVVSSGISNNFNFKNTITNDTAVSLEIQRDPVGLRDLSISSNITGISGVVDEAYRAHKGTKLKGLNASYRLKRHTKNPPKRKGNKPNNKNEASLMPQKSKKIEINKNKTSTDIKTSPAPLTSENIDKQALRNFIRDYEARVQPFEIWVPEFASNEMKRIIMNEKGVSIDPKKSYIACFEYSNSCTDSENIELKCPAGLQYVKPVFWMELYKLLYRGFPPRVHSSLAQDVDMLAAIIKIMPTENILTYGPEQLAEIKLSDLVNPLSNYNFFSEAKRKLDDSYKIKPQHIKYYFFQALLLLSRVKADFSFEAIKDVLVATGVSDEKRKIEISKLVIEGEVSTQLYIFNNRGSGRYILYFPNYKEGYFEFNKYTALKNWLNNNIKDIKFRQALTQQFTYYQRQGNKGIDNIFKELAEGYRKEMKISKKAINAKGDMTAEQMAIADKTGININSIKLFEDIYDSKLRFEDSCLDTLTVSKTEYTLATIREYMNAVNTAIPNPISQVATLALDLELAIDGDLEEQRTEGWVSFGTNVGAIIITELTGGCARLAAISESEIESNGFGYISKFKKTTKLSERLQKLQEQGLGGHGSKMAGKLWASTSLKSSLEKWTKNAPEAERSVREAIVNQITLSEEEEIKKLDLSLSTVKVKITSWPEQLPPVEEINISGQPILAQTLSKIKYINVKRLIARRCGLESVEDVPRSVKELDISYNRIKSLKHLPKKTESIVYEGEYPKETASKSLYEKMKGADSKPTDADFYQSLKNWVDSSPEQEKAYRLDLSRLFEEQWINKDPDNVLNLMRLSDSPRSGMLSSLPEHMPSYKMVDFSGQYLLASKKIKIPGVVNLIIKECNLSSLESIPDTVEILDVSKNKLSSLEDLPSSVHTLIASYNKLGDISPEVYQQLKSVDISNNGIRAIPEIALDNLEVLKASKNLISSPPHVGFKLLELEISDNLLSGWPDISKAKNLRVFKAKNIRQTTLPEAYFDHLEKLTEVDLSQNSIEGDLVINNKNIKYLNLSLNKLKRAQVSGEMVRLDLSGNEIVDFDAGSLMKLASLNIRHNPALRQLTGLNSPQLYLLDISECDSLKEIPYFPSEELSFIYIQDNKSLEVFSGFKSKNAERIIIKGNPKLKQIGSVNSQAPVIVDISDNSLEDTVTINAPYIKSLVAKNNKIRSIVFETTCNQLREIDLEKNLLEDFSVSAENLKDLKLSFNRLEAISLDYPKLENVWLPDNRLTSLRGVILARLRYINLANNFLRSLPDFLREENVADDVIIVLNNNPLPAEVALEIEHDMAFGNGNGPLIIAPPSNQETDLALVVRYWLPEEQITAQQEKWLAISKEPGAGAFGTFLLRLQRVKGLSGEAISEWLEELRSVSPLRSHIFAEAQEATSSCIDRVMFYWNRMQDLRFIYKIQSGVYKYNTKDFRTVYKIGREQFRITKLIELAEKRMAQIKADPANVQETDDIETVLSLLVWLRHSLKLPNYYVKDMNFFNFAGINKDHLFSAELLVKHLENQNFLDWFAEWEPYNRYLEVSVKDKYDKLQSELERINEHAEQKIQEISTGQEKILTDRDIIEQRQRDMHNHKMALLNQFTSIMKFNEHIKRTWNDVRSSELLTSIVEDAVEKGRYSVEKLPDMIKDALDIFYIEFLESEAKIRANMRGDISAFDIFNALLFETKTEFEINVPFQIESLERSFLERGESSRVALKGLNYKDISFPVWISNFRPWQNLIKRLAPELEKELAPAEARLEVEYDDKVIDILNKNNEVAITKEIWPTTLQVRDQLKVVINLLRTKAFIKKYQLQKYF